MSLNLSLLALEIIFLGTGALVLHWASLRYGLAPLLIFLTGLVAVLHAVGSVPIFVLVGGLQFEVSNTTVVPVVLMVLLVLYEVEGTATARVTILGIMGLSLLVLAVQLTRQLHMELPGGFNQVGLPADHQVFARSGRMTLASMLGFAGGLGGVVIVFQWLRNHWPESPRWVHPGVALLVALTADDVLFRLVAFGWGPFVAALPGGLWGKSMGALILWPFIGLYLQRVGPRFPQYVARRERPSLDVVFGTYHAKELDLRATKQRQKQTEKRLQAVVDHAPIIVFNVDPEGVFTLSEGAGLSALGLEPGEVVGLSAFELFPETETQLRGALEGKRFSTEVQVRDLVYDVTYTPVWEEGVVSGVNGVATDISSRRHAERALQESEGRFRNTFQHAAVGLVHADPHGVILRANHAIQDLLRYGEDELKGRRLLEFVHKDHHVADATAWRALREGSRELVDSDMRCLTKQGEEVWAHATASLIRDTEGEPQYFIVAIEDLTDRRATEAQLRQAQKMEAVGQLTGGVAHDFNNLLTVVMGGLEMALEPGGDATESTEALEQALEAAGRGASLTQRLLAFSRRQALMPETVHAGRLVDGMRKLLVRTLGEAVEIHIDVSPDVGRCIVDRAQMENAILNLALNARDAMPDGGNLHLTAERVEIDDEMAAANEAEPGSYVRVSVEDDGTGIVADELARVFEPFFTTKEAGKGSGLGLSMVYGFTQQSNGFVTVDSTLGIGTAVRLHLPATSLDPKDSAAAQGLPGDHRGRGERILVLEDDTGVLGLLEVLLSGLGYVVIPATRGSEALDILQARGDIDLLLSDIVLPGGMSGTQVAEQALKIQPRLPILFASGYSGAELASDQGRGSTTRVLQKPFRRAELAEALSTALSSRRTGP